MLIVKRSRHIFETCFDDTEVLNIFSSDARGELVASSFCDFVTLYYESQLRVDLVHGVCYNWSVL